MRRQRYSQVTVLCLDDFERVDRKGVRGASRFLYVRFTAIARFSSLRSVPHNDVSISPWSVIEVI